MVDEDFRRKNLGPQITGGAKIRFTDIDGIGPKTARKLEQVIGVNAPKDVADYSAKELAEEAGISKSRAEKAIRGGGGTPSYSERNTTGSVGAGGIAESLDEGREAKAQRLSQFGTDDVRQGIMAAGMNVERQPGISQSKKADQSDLTELPEQDLIRIGRLSENFSDATADPFDPDATPPIDATEEEREQAATARVAARRELGGRGFDRDEIGSVFAEQPESDEFQSPFAQTLFSGPSDFGEYDTDREEYARAKQIQSERSPEQKRVDNNRKAPVTDEISTWRSDKSHWDYPGIDTPTRGPAFFQGRGTGNGSTGNDRVQLDLPDTTLAQLRTGLNERTDDYFDAYEPNNQDRLQGIKDRISIGDPINLSPAEFQTAKRILKDEKDKAEDIAERKEANIFGSTKEQADRANQAYRGLINNPPR